jgi:hypothetical protein
MTSKVAALPVKKHAGKSNKANNLFTDLPGHFIDADPVNNPEHYTRGDVECIEAIKAALGTPGYIGFLQGQIMKYVWRMGLKANNDMRTDARKAQWYMSELVAFLYKKS